jgi:Ca-activated chloride channel family protein
MMGEGWRLAWPMGLLLLLLVPPLMWWSGRRRRRSAVLYSSVDLLDGAGISLRQRAIWLPAALRAAGLTMLIVALARPQEGIGEVRTTAQGVAIMAVVDRSASMSIPMSFGGETMPRLDVVKKVFSQFVEGDGKSLKGRPEDLVGLVTFALFPETVCPLVRIHDTLVKLVDTIVMADQQYEAGTAIGDGLALAAARLHEAETEINERNEGKTDPDFVIKSKAIILLTDGDENRGEVRAIDAAEMCKQWGIRIYAIGIGDDRGGVVQTPMGKMRLPRGDGFNEALMLQMAELTGGLYRKAADGEALTRIYREIDSLEKTEIKSTEFTNYRERFMDWAGAGVALIALELLLSATILRRIP